MTNRRKTFSICIPAYNRTRHLRPLLDSVFAQDYTDFDVVICEDRSPERAQIAAIVQSYAERYPGRVLYYENERNLGYDGNIRNLVEKATGEFCFFMGNDDLMCPGAMATVAGLLRRHENVGLVMKSYAWFDHVPENINQEVRYFTEERVFAPGREAITLCFRRSGVIAGYVVHRDSAQAVATSKYDGTLYYQMHLTAQVLATRCAVFTPEVLVLCRNGEPPEFGNSAREKGKYVPGGYTPQARLNMVGGALSIIEDLKQSKNVDLVDDVKRDYANYFYVYIKDQLTLPLKEFIALYRGFARMGLYRYPLFHVYFILGYLLGEKKFDLMTKKVRGLLGRSPHFGRLGHAN
jgi:glycosyltransferase involved in cell wall biosynthesis